MNGRRNWRCGRRNYYMWTHLLEHFSRVCIWAKSQCKYNDEIVIWFVEHFQNYCKIPVVLIEYFEESREMLCVFFTENVADSMLFEFYIKRCLASEVSPKPEHFVWARFSRWRAATYGTCQLHSPKFMEFVVWQGSADQINENIFNFGIVCPKTHSHLRRATELNVSAQLDFRMCHGIQFPEPVTNNTIWNMRTAITFWHMSSITSTVPHCGLHIS